MTITEIKAEEESDNSKALSPKKTKKPSDLLRSFEFLRAHLTQGELKDPYLREIVLFYHE
mgnify:CR=1 FL=1